MLKHIKFIAAALAILALALPFSGCTSPVVVDISKLTPTEVVKNYWRDLDTGDYDKAFDLVYNDGNLSRSVWVKEHFDTYGPNGTYIEIKNFTVISEKPIAPGTFTGNFNETMSLTVRMNTTYMSVSSSGIVQNVVVKTPDGWKMFGNY